MSLKYAASIDDLRLIAKRRIPRFAFDLVDGGAEDESNLRRNREAFDAVRLTPRYMVDVSAPSIEVELFGRTYAAPFGVAPMGLLNVFWPDADLHLARLAAKQKIPYVASGVASTRLEDLAENADGMAWFQLYTSSDWDLTNRLLGRAENAGYEVLIVTVDVPTAAKRDRDIRNRLQIPFRLKPKIALDLLLNPRWSVETLIGGRPTIANYVDHDRSSNSLAALQTKLISSSFDWGQLKRIRDRWSGRLLVKGIMHADDALGCFEAGCDGIVVSNHGGRQLASGAASLEALPAIANMVGGKMSILLDSGIRRGTDIVRAKAFGADFALLGRSFAYGVGAGGAAGAKHAYHTIEVELLRALGQLGRPEFSTVDPSLLANGNWVAGSNSAQFPYSHLAAGPHSERGLL
ncbi:MAG: alpha-hydroxy acid oxidase [Pseudomonadota bacterium]